MSAPAAGFTLVEVLVSVSLMSAVAVAAIGALNVVADGAATTSGAASQRLEVEAAARLLARDVHDAITLSVGADTIFVELPGGGAVGYERTPNGEELHRVADTSLGAVQSALTVLDLPSFTPPTPSDSGFMKDADYRATAVLQQLRDVSWTPLVASSVEIGLEIRIEYGEAASPRVTRRSAVSTNLAP